ncbi:MAG: Rab family GTPase [Promethearchaeota archaeon]|jgi:small GTP-binding protein
MSYDRKNILYSFKIVICGSNSVGKTCLFNRYCFNSFNFDTTPTIGINFHSINLKINSETDPKELREHYIVNSIFDFGGQERFKPLVGQFLEGSSGALLVFDSVNQLSFEELDFWYEQIITNAVSSDIPIILVGSKSDLIEKVDDSEVVNDALIHKYIEERQLDNFFRTSALENYNVLELFKELNNLMLKRQDLPFIVS